MYLALRRAMSAVKSYGPKAEVGATCRGPISSSCRQFARSDFFIAISQMLTVLKAKLIAGGALQYRPYDRFGGAAGSLKPVSDGWRQLVVDQNSARFIRRGPQRAGR